MNFGQAFTYPFQDPDWAKKILIPALIFLIPIVGQIFMFGWMLDITRRVIRRDPTPLPELDFGRQFGDGLKALVVSLVYSIPVFILVAPIMITSALAGGGGMDEETLAAIISLTSLCCGGLIFLYALVLAVVTPAAYANMITKGSIGAGLRFGEVIGLVRAAPGAYLMVLLGTIVSGFIAQLGAVACAIGVIATYAYAMAVNGHLYGQAYNEATGNKEIGGSEGFAQIY